MDFCVEILILDVKLLNVLLLNKFICKCRIKIIKCRLVIYVKYFVLEKILKNIVVSLWFRLVCI